MTIGGLLTVGPVDLQTTPSIAAETINATAVGSGVNGPQAAQTGMLINFSKDGWFTGGAVGEIDGLGITVRQNGAGSDSSGILINEQNEGNGFLSATEFVSSIVDPNANVLTYAIDVQEGVLDKVVGNYIGAVYNADVGALSTGVLIQNSPGASWQNALMYLKDGNELFSVDGAGNIAAASLTLSAVNLNGDTTNGSIDVGNPNNSSATPYLDLNGFGTASDVRIINDANGQATIETSTQGQLQVNANGVFINGSYHLNLATPASSSAPCTTGQVGADANYVYICVSTNSWKRTMLQTF